MSRSKRIKLSIFMLKAVELMEGELFHRKSGTQISQSPTSGALSDPDSQKPPIMRLIEIAECLDRNGQGNMVDFEFVQFLNSYLNYDIRQFLDNFA